MSMRLNSSTRSVPSVSLEGCSTNEENIQQWMLNNNFTQNMKSKITENRIDLDTLRTGKENDIR